MVVGAFLFAAMFYFYYALPRRLIGPVQPIYFSHRVHAGVKQIHCRFCHPYVELSKNAGLPPLQTCFICHKYIIPNHPQIQLLKDYYDARRPVAWLRAFVLPDFVFFHHHPHITWAALDCVECHGLVNRQDRLAQVTFQMGFCVNCHRKMNAEIDCWLACHR